MYRSIRALRKTPQRVDPDLYLSLQLHQNLGMEIVMLVYP